MKRVLLVEDDRDDQFLMMTAFLAHEKVELLALASDGTEAITLLEHLPADNLPKFIIADINMPTMGGTELLTFLKTQQRYKSIPVLLYSVSVHRLDRDHVLRNGALDIISKPYSFNDYVEIAGSILDRLGAGDHHLKNSL